MEEKLLENEELVRVRPTFLTIICILSFIYSAWVLFNGLMNMGEGVEDHVKQYALLTTISAVFSIIGTSLMWNIRQFGFGLFSAGTALSIGGSIFIFGTSYVLNLSTGYPAYVSLAFLLMFALNYKHMD